MILSKDVCKCLGAIFSGKDLIAHAGNLVKKLHLKMAKLRNRQNVLSERLDLSLKSCLVEFFALGCFYLEVNILVEVYWEVSLLDVSGAKTWRQYNSAFMVFPIYAIWQLLILQIHGLGR